MTNALKGALLSGLILPGLGQIALKHHIRGVVILLAVLVSTIVFVAKAVERALAILEKIELEGGAISMDVILNATKQASANSGNTTLNLLFLLIGVCWIAGTVDAYIIGRKKDNELTN
jgi:TM2 domain-containing membrane protein YozV